MTSKNIEYKTNIIQYSCIYSHFTYMIIITHPYTYRTNEREIRFRVVKNIPNTLREYNGKIEIKDQPCVKKSTFSVTKR